jgi:hypothetical protein
MNGPKNIIWRWTPPLEERESPNYSDTADEYLIEAVPEALSGIVLWGRYHGRWIANPGCRQVIRELLRVAGLDQMEGER